MVKSCIPPKKNIVAIIADHPGKFKLKSFIIKIIAKYKNAPIETKKPNSNEIFKGASEKEIKADSKKLSITLRL